jgi:predicted CXXCH cytochrome family protein
MKWFTAVALAVAASPAWAAGPRPTVKGSKHDLSVTGPGPIRAVSERNECTFCHFPHSGTNNRPDPRATYVPYASSTMTARTGAPTGASRVCLSCHDGTIAVGETRTRKIQMTVQYIPPESRSNLGTDLRRTHPISFRPAGSSGTHPPVGGDRVKLDATGQVQCTSCHDPHKEFNDPVVGKFLAKPSARSALCLSCHDAVAVDAPGSSHANAAAAFGAAEGNTTPFRTVAEAGCTACHPSHQGDTVKGRLVPRPGNDDDALCLRCHSGTVSRFNLKAELSKASAHSGIGRGAHDAAEGRPGRPETLPETSPAAKRHATCVDCHDPHAAASRKTSGDLATGPLARVWGIDLRGQRVEQVRYEYELCFKCHGDSANAPAARGSASGGAPVRAFPEPNLRNVFQPSSPSYHPVGAAGRNLDVPGLVAPLTAVSVITCGDCHAAENGPGLGSAPRGPHGSFYPKLLERNYTVQDRTVESRASYALCYKCHDRDTLLQPAAPGKPTTYFPQHALHVGPRVNASCATCHDSHGVSAQAGSPQENAHLVNFDTDVVKPLRGIRRYLSQGVGTGSCNLTCHGRDHGTDPNTRLTTGVYSRSVTSSSFTR